MTTSEGERPAAVPDEPPRRLAHGARSFVTRRSAPQKVSVVAAILLLLTAPFGGLSKTHEDDVEKLSYAQKLDIGPFLLEIEKVLTIPDLAPSVTPEPGNKLFVIDVDVTANTDRAEALTLATAAFGATGVDARPWPGDESAALRAYDVNDGAEFDSGERINPGIGYEVALILQVPGDWKPEQVVLRVTGYHFQVQDPLASNDGTWVLDDAPLASGAITVEEKA